MRFLRERGDLRWHVIECVVVFHVFINIHEKQNLMCYELDHFSKHAVPKHSFKIRLGTIGHLKTAV